MNEDYNQGLYDELYRLQDAVRAVEPTDPWHDAKVAHLEGCIEWVLEEMELAGLEV